MQDTKNRKDRRQYPRFEIPLKLRQTELFGKEGRVQNISRGGIRIFGTKDIDVGTILKIDFTLPNGEWIMAEVLVIWARERPSESVLKYDIGCRFTEVIPDLHQLLLEHLAKISPPEKIKI